ncbi:Hypothetical_protein [Hexamita inflata]|uniref:Hypothetical_protein n=1 Tax=Hexamita inflata TaxID=28002 RepID=A0AA86PY40_9EUKA|nr:Hypothetical protein HINF_LOCUS34616 [Hexamita inflata]
MPYIIGNEDDYNLDLKWTDDQMAQQFDINQLKNIYACINIDGSNHSEFNQFEILSRSSRFGIINCSVDLSLINTNIEYLCLNNCVCHNNFSSIQIDELILNCSLLKVAQLNQLKLQRLSVDLKDDVSFDYWNCGQLSCVLHHLSLTGIKINLYDLQGYWEFGFIELCTITGYQFNEKFGIQMQDYIIASREDLNVLQFIQCDQTCVYARAEENQLWDFQGVGSQQIQSISLQNYIVDITNIPNYYKKAVFIDCNFIGQLTNAFDNFQQVKIIVKEQSKLDDVHKLSGITPTEFRIKLEDIKIQKINNIDKCNPTILHLTDCSIDISQLHGQWKHLRFDNCNLLNTAECKIIAKDLQINESDIKYLHNFEAQVAQLSFIDIESFPHAKKLQITNSTINLTQENNSVEKLFFKSCTFKQFSVKMMKKLLSVQFAQSKVQIPLNKFIQKKNKLMKMSRKNVHRIQNEKYKMNVKTTFISKIKEKINLTIEIISFERTME